MINGGSRSKRIASALSAAIVVGDVRNSFAGSAQRRKRHLVLVAAAHLHGRLPAADCTRELLATLTLTIERTVMRSPRAKGVNVKFIQRDQFCDRIYRRIRSLPGKAPSPRCPDGTLMSRAQLEAAVATDRWWIGAIETRRNAYAIETEDDLEAFRNLLVQPMPLEERVRRYAPPLVPPAPIVVGRDLRRASDVELAVIHRDCRRRLKVIQAALRIDVVARARKLAAIHRRVLELG